jgi:hypothetical protein
MAPKYIFLESVLSELDRSVSESFSVECGTTYESVCGEDRFTKPSARNIELVTAVSTSAVTQSTRLEQVPRARNELGQVLQLVLFGVYLFL